MHIALSGTFSGQPRTIEVRGTDEEKLHVSISWRGRNAGNDGEEIYSQSIVVSRAELKKALELL